MGRKPKPTVLKRLAGNPGKRALNGSEPTFERAGNVRAPRGRLSESGKLLWRELAPRLDAAGLLTEADVFALEMLCMHYGLAKDADQIIREQGMMTTDERGMIRKHPLLQVVRDNSAAWRSYALEFGLTPSSRSRVHAQEGDDEPSLAELLFAEVSDE